MLPLSEAKGRNDEQKFASKQRDGREGDARDFGWLNTEISAQRGVGENAENVELIEMNSVIAEDQHFDEDEHHERGQHCRERYPGCASPSVGFIADVRSSEQCTARNERADQRRRQQ